MKAKIFKAAREKGTVFTEEEARGRSMACFSSGRPKPERRNDGFKLLQEDLCTRTSGPVKELSKMKTNEGLLKTFER